LPDLGQTELSFPDQFVGKVVAVRFWADWCPFCETEMEAIEPVYRRYRDQGLVILAINVRQDRATAQAFVDKLNISYQTLLDTRGDVARAYGVMGLPTTFIIDRDGRLYSRIIGESTPQLLEKIVRELL
jgi:thiol-disulfide isomerase/thioredoxin